MGSNTTADSVCRHTPRNVRKFVGLRICAKRGIMAQLYTQGCQCWSRPGIGQRCALAAHANMYSSLAVVRRVWDYTLKRGILHMTAVGFEPTPLRTGALSQRLRPLGQTVLTFTMPAMFDCGAHTHTVSRHADPHGCVFRAHNTPRAPAEQPRQEELEIPWWTGVAKLGFNEGDSHAK